METIQEDTIEIKCPLCPFNHRYKLMIERALVLGASEDEEDEVCEKVTVTRLFTCPQKNQDFQVTFRVDKIPNLEIASVKVENIS